MDNLILHKDVSGNYNAYIAEYSLSPSEKREIENGVTIPLKLPNSISNVQNSSKISIGGDGSDCLEIKTESISVCRDKNGNEIPNNGELGNGCVGMPYETVQFVFVIDAGCLSNGGGSGGGSNPYVPTDPGNGYEGGGHGGGGNSGDGTGYYPSNPGTGDGTGNTPTPQTPGLADQDGNPLVTTPILIDDSSFRFFRSLTPEQKNWWNNSANTQYTQDMTQYLLEHNYSLEASEFAIEALKELINGGDVDFRYEVIITSSFKNNAKLMRVFNRSGGLPTFKRYLQNFDSQFSVAHLKLDVSTSLPASINAETSPPDNYIITIIFNGNNLERPDLSIARTLIHEMIHAEIFRKMLSEIRHPSLDNITLTDIINMRDNFPGLADYYVRWLNNLTPGLTSTSAQHQMMAEHYRIIIRNALSEYDNSVPSDIIDALSWVGLWNTISWNNLSNIERIRIEQIIDNFEN